MDYSAEPSVWFAAGPPSQSTPVFASMPSLQSTPSTSSLASLAFFASLASSTSTPPTSSLASFASFASLVSGASFTAGAGTAGVTTVATTGGCTGVGLVVADAMPTPPSSSPIAAIDVSNRRRVREPSFLDVLITFPFVGYLCELHGVRMPEVTLILADKLRYSSYHSASVQFRLRASIARSSSRIGRKPE